jgi:hypothetical protein
MRFLFEYQQLGFSVYIIMTMYFLEGTYSQKCLLHYNISGSQAVALGTGRFIYVNNLRGSIRPHQEKFIDITIFLNEHSIRGLVTWKGGVIEEVIAIDIYQAKSFFVSLRARITPGIVGHSLRTLVPLRGGVVTEHPFISFMGNDPFQYVPNEYIRLVDYILAHTDEGLFLENGEEMLERIIMQNLKQAKPWDKEITNAGSRGVHSMVIIFLRLLHSLSESIIPSTNVERVLNLRIAETTILLEKVPPL